MKKTLAVLLLLCGCIPMTASTISPIQDKNGIKRGTMNITFKNTSGSNAKITAIASDGEFFTGNLVDEKSQSIGSSGSSGEEDYAGTKGTSTRTHYTNRSSASIKYSSKAVAVLIGNRSHSMKCSFTLSNPSLGVTSGAVGECKISDGRVVPVSLSKPN